MQGGGFLAATVCIREVEVEVGVLQPGGPADEPPVYHVHQPCASP